LTHADPGYQEYACKKSMMEKSMMEPTHGRNGISIVESARRVHRNRGIDGEDIQLISCSVQPSRIALRGRRCPLAAFSLLVGDGATTRSDAM